MVADFNKQRALVQKMVKTSFQHAWAYRIEIEGQPSDFEIFVKDISYGPVEIGTNPIKVGVNNLTFPNSVEPVAISMTVRDHEDERIYKWLNDWASKVVNGDGTVNPPLHPQVGYLKKWRRYQLVHGESGGFRENLSREWSVYPTQMGDIAESYSEHGLLEFPISFVQFRA